MMATKSYSKPIGVSLFIFALVIVSGLLYLVRDQVAAAAWQTDPPLCGLDGVTCPLVGGFNPISVEPAPGAWQVSGPSAPSFGALVYDPDFKDIEKRARAKLKCGLGVREAISPYKGNVEFQEYVKTFDYEVGWSQSTTEFAGTECFPGTTYTLGQVVDGAEQSLREARDLYAYLLVYAPELRFRADEYYNGDPPEGFDEALCGPLDPDDGSPLDKEDPDPDNPDYTGLVLDPVIDWCNFRARFRQSVREAANLRLIFGQQVMVEAMGLHFSGDFVGGENAVREELAQLRFAWHQYQLAEQGLAEALGKAVGSGCYVSDFYTQSEWSLLSRAIQNQETAQHHIATRLSYMDIASPASVPQAHANAQDAFRQASNDGYIKLIGMASLNAAQPLGEGCNVGERPDGLLAAEMAANLIETRRKAHEMADGRNVFGFDVSFTPARPFKLPTSSEDLGLWDEAKRAAEYAKELQNDEVINTRLFDDSQEDLRIEIEKIRGEYDTLVGDNSGCYRSDFPNDQAWYTGVDNQVTLLNACLAHVNNDDISDTNPFNNCMDDVGLKDGEAKQALYELRAIYMGYQNIEKKVANIQERINNSNDRNATVTKWLGLSGGFQTAAKVAEVAFNFVTCLDFGETGLSEAKSTVPCTASAAAYAAMEVTAGGISTQADIEIENAINEQETSDLVLDASELMIEAYSTQQQYFSKKSEFLAMLDDLQSDLLEAQRARYYFQHSPANDPSYRIVRDSSRLVLAKKLAFAARVAYLAARRAEYEHAARLSASGFRISDIYRSRTADDIISFLDDLDDLTENLPGGQASDTNAIDFKISITRHILHLTDERLANEGFTDPAAAQAERTRRLRAWVAQNTVNDPAISSKPVLQFSFTTSLLEDGLFSQVIQEGYERFWLLKLSGLSEPKPESNGVSLNLLSDQAGLSYRTVSLTQGGLVHLRSFAGCTFDYRLLAPAVLLGLEWPQDQNPEVATAVWKANVNESHAYTESSFRTPSFLGRAASSTDWQVLVYSGAPADGLPDMDLQQLTDIELIFSTTYASRELGDPHPSECTRIDY